MVKNLEAIQKMAMIHEVCISKTGCLTTGEMTVASYQVLDQTHVTHHEPYPLYFRDRLEIHEDTKKMIYECILVYI